MRWQNHRHNYCRLQATTHIAQYLVKKSLSSLDCSSQTNTILFRSFLTSVVINVVLTANAALSGEQRQPLNLNHCTLYT
ncbi:hypothetical protein CGI56_24595 [Vibrio parahaemolyticus]|nr:hypothetical protein CGI56_24595 [Vibrio parahaemolyticus]